MIELFTIGYSDHSLESFVAILKKHRISAIADVRSIPYSKFNPGFNQDTLSRYLKVNNIAYVFLGHQCGARFDDPSCYKNGKADYRLISKHPRFKDGLDRIRRGAIKYKVALMCAEKDPINCHRMILVCRNLKDDQIRIKHILDINRVEDQFESEKRLLKVFKLDQPELFRDQNDLIEKAYDKQSEKIAFKEELYSNNEKNGEDYIMPETKLFTIGFTKKDAKTFFTTIKKAGIKRILDIRLNNVSQLAGFTKKDDLEYFLRELCDCEYRHEPQLAPTKDILDSYKKKSIDWPEYEIRFGQLMKDRKAHTLVNPDELNNACLLCSEPTPDKCHRRLVAEYLKRCFENIEIHHL